MKKVFKTIVAVFILGLLFSALYSEEKLTHKKQVIVTKYFDIIFSSESRESALILAEHVDDLYLKACDLLDSEPYFRLPVSLISGVDVLNGYFSLTPYNHIVLYDTLPSEESLAVFSENLLSVFYHELVHAVSMQKKSRFWKSFGKIFGDIFTPAPFLYTPLFLVEGVTVSLESAEGEGRLNDAFATEVFRQAKIEGQFPNWMEASQARDIYPVGSLPYLFGGAFSAYLQNQYGMEKYAKLWEEFGRLHFLGSLDKMFTKVYEKKLSELWKDFEDSIFVPKTETIIDPRNEIEIKPLVTKKALYQHARQSKKGYAWFDASANEIWHESFETGYREKIATTSDGQGDISLSLDGRFLISSFVDNYPFGSNQVEVYEIESRKKIQSFFGLRDGRLLKSADGKDYLAGVKTDGQKASIELWPFLQIAKEAQYKKTFPSNTIPFSLTPLEDGRLAYILKEKNDWSIVIWNPLDESEEKIVFQTGKEVLKYLNPVFENGSLSALSFSYGEKNELPKMALYDFETKLFFVQTETFSGGLHYPLVRDAAIIFVSHFFEYDFLFVSPLDSIFQNAKIVEAKFTLEEKSNNLDYVENYVDKDGEKYIENNVNKYVENNIEKHIEKYVGEHSPNDLSFQEKLLEDYKTKKYNPFLYFTKGIFLPTVEIDIHESTSSLDLPDVSLFLGFLWLTGDPFDQWQIQLQPSYDIIKERFQFKTEIVNTSFGLPIVFQGKSILGLDGYILNDYSLSPSLHYQFGNSIYQLDFVSSLFLLNGRNNNGSDLTSYLYNGNKISLSSLRNVGLNFFSLKGFETGFHFWIFDNHVSDALSIQNIRYSFFASFAFPKLLPIENTLRFTYNLPSVFEASLFASENVYKEEPVLWSASANTTLFAYDFQKGLLGTYVQRFVIKADYACMQGLGTNDKNDSESLSLPFYPIDYFNPLDNFSNYSMKNFSHSIGLSAHFTYSAIMGMMITQLKFDMGGEFRYHIKEKKLEYGFVFNLNL